MTSAGSTTKCARHEALQMRTPVWLWQQSQAVRVAAGALGVSGWGTCASAGWRREAASLRTKLEYRPGPAREWVRLLRLEDRVQVYYCRTLIRELNLTIQRSTAVERWTVKVV